MKRFFIQINNGNAARLALFWQNKYLCFANAPSRHVHIINLEITEIYIAFVMLRRQY